MDDWIFCIKDSALDTIQVVGSGNNVQDAEDDARWRWTATCSGRADFQDRTPIQICTPTITTYTVGEHIPTLIT